MHIESMNRVGQWPVSACIIANRAEVIVIESHGLSVNERSIVWNSPRKSSSSKAGITTTAVITIIILTEIWGYSVMNSSSWCCPI